MKRDTFGRSYTVAEAMLKLMQFCAYRERSQKEVEDKLLEMRMISQAREEITIKLMQDDFLNEERYARSFVRGKFRIKKWGRNKIKHALKSKDISAPIIQLALTEIDDEQYLETLYELAEKKLRLIQESDKYKRRNKLSSYLIQKGFESNLVFEATAIVIP